MNERPKVGVASIIIKNDKVLLGRRKGTSHGNDTWHFPGGHLEFMESLKECAKRETMEESNLNIKDVSFLAITNDFFEKENKHYITIFMKARYDSGEVKVMEPDKCECWKWFEWEELPKPLMKPIENFLKLNINPFE